MAFPKGELTIDLRAVRNNWQTLKSQLDSGVECGAVVKANAYGLGVKKIVLALYQSGCRNYFVTNLEEAVEIQSLLPADSRIFVLCGCNPGEELEFVHRGLIPVIISTAMFCRWHNSIRQLKSNTPAFSAVLKINTGMCRLGIDINEFETLLNDSRQLQVAGISMLMSHFACAEEANHPLNQKQIDRFSSCMERAKKTLPIVSGTLSNSSGIFLSKRAHFNLVRPGIAIYGGNPQPEKPNVMAPVVTLGLPVIQIRDVPAGEAIGYGATNSVSHNRVIAIVAGGYADGILRIMGNKGYGFFSQRQVPIVGRISMDSTAFDVSAIPVEQRPKEGDTIALLNQSSPIDNLASTVGTISYEILTALGSRYIRTYIE